MVFIISVGAHFPFGQGPNRMQTLQKRFQCILTLISAQKSRRVLFVLTTSSGRNHTLKFQVRQVCFKNGVFLVFFPQKTASNRYTSVCMRFRPRPKWKCATFTMKNIINQGTSNVLQDFLEYWSGRNGLAMPRKAYRPTQFGRNDPQNGYPPPKWLRTVRSVAEMAMTLV